MRWADISIFFLTLIVSTIGAGRAFGQNANTDRNKMIRDYLDDVQNTHDLYASAPITHIIPAFNTITYALAADYRNVTILPPAKDRIDANNTESLKLGGNTLSPYLALSLKNIALGFSAESGQRTAQYSLKETADHSSQVVAMGIQQSKVDFKSVGAFLYLIPYPDFHKSVTATIILGGRSYNCRHEVSQDMFGDANTEIKTDDKQTFNYNISRYEVGLNIGIQLLKSFSIIPWADYVVTDASSARQLTKPSADVQGDTIFPGSIRYNLNDDIDLFWFDQPRMSYGLDFAVRIHRFEIHLGDAFGKVAAFDKNPDQVKDQTLTLTISFDQKGS